MVVDLEKELVAALASPSVVAMLEALIRRVVREELAYAGVGDEILDVARAASLLGMTQAAIGKAVQRGTLPCLRLGRRLRFRRSDLVGRSVPSRSKR